MSEYSVFTSESVSEGHPDKMADQISDAIVDAMLKDDPNSRIAVETLVKTGMVVLAGEVRTSTYVDLEDVVRDVILDIGYDSSEVGFDGASCAVLNAIGTQSVDIAVCVDDLEAEHSRFTDLDIKPTDIVAFAPDNNLIARFFFITDPDGYKIEVLQRHGHYQ